MVAEAENGLDAIDAYRKHLTDVVVMDLRMAGQNGIDAIRALPNEFSQARVFVFSTYASGEEIFQAVKAGANGFLVKEMSLERLLEAIRTVQSGQPYMPDEISKRLSGLLVSQLSPREVEVLTLIARGRARSIPGLDGTFLPPESRGECRQTSKARNTARTTRL